MSRASASSRGWKIAAQLLQFFPLACFLFAAFRRGTPQLEDWLIAFMVGGAAAAIQVVVALALARGGALNRLVLGANAYLAVGGLAALAGQMWLLQALNGLRESGLFLCVVAVGAVTTFGSKAGFVGQEDRSGRSRTMRYSLGLLALAALAAVPSFCLRGQLLYSAVIPLTLLSIAQRWLAGRLQRA